MKSASFAAAALAALLLAPAAAFAQETPGQLGVGAYLGIPLGATAKYILTDRDALDLAMGAQGGNFDVHFDYLRGLPGVIGQPARGTLTPYLGLGMKIEDQDETLFGFRFVGGASYHWPSAPLELFAEVAPVLRAAPSVGANFDGGAGVRWYFSLPGR